MMREFNFGVRYCFKYLIEHSKALYLCFSLLFMIPLAISLTFPSKYDFQGDFIRRMYVLVLWGGRFAIPWPSGIMKRKQEDLCLLRSQWYWEWVSWDLSQGLRWPNTITSADWPWNSPWFTAPVGCTALLRNQGDYGMLTVGRTPSERDSKGHSRSLERFLHVRPFFCLFCVVDCSTWTVHLIFILYYFLLAAAVYHGNNSRWGDAKNRKCCSLRSCFHLIDFASKTTDRCNNQTNSPKTPTK